MRRVLACLVVVAALVLPALAGATSMPPLQGLQAGVKFVQVKSNRASCSEQGRTRKTSRLAKKLAPVACEQPPRPKVRNTIAVIYFGF